MSIITSFPDGNGDIDFSQLIQDLSNSYNQHIQTTDQRKLQKLYELYESDHIYDMMVGFYRLVVDMECCGKKITCLLDTGAQVNILYGKTVTQLNMWDCVDTSTKSDIVGVNGISQSRGFIPYLQMSIGNISFPSCFVVVEREKCDNDCIIGLMFMRFYGMCLDVGTNIVRIGSVSIPFRLA